MRCSLSFALVIAVVPVAGAQHYRITDLGSITPVAINVWGQVAGNLNNHAVVWTNNKVRDLGALPGGTFSAADAINDLGVVAGTGDGPGTLTNPAFSPDSCNLLVQPFVWSPLKGFVSAPPLPSFGDVLRDPPDACNQKTYATGINLLGQVI